MVSRPLTARFVETINKPGRYGDGRGGHGLILNVHEMADGRISRSWIQRLRIGGQFTHLGLGSYPVVTLAAARKVALVNRRAVAEGKDPRSGGVPTFAVALDKVIEIQRETWRDGKSEAQWRSSLSEYARALMRKRVDKITSADVLAALTPIWNTKRVTAQRVKQRIGAVMKWAMANGYRESNPVDAVAAALPRVGTAKAHHKAVPYAEVGATVAAVRGSVALPSTKLAFEFLVLTAARSNEVRGATWNEIDLDAAIWTVPASRMKAKKEHRVPLADATLAVLAEAAKYRRDDSDFVFPSARGGGVMSNVAFWSLLQKLDIDATVHGFRSSFRDWASECTNTPHAVMESALAHVIKDKAEAAYARSDLLEKRRALMDAWAVFVTSDRADANVLQLRHSGVVAGHAGVVG